MYKHWDKYIGPISPYYWLTFLVGVRPWSFWRKKTSINPQSSINGNFWSQDCQIKVDLSKFIIWLVVSTHPKNISQNGNLPQIGMKIENMWNHHPIMYGDHMATFEAANSASHFFGSPKMGRNPQLQNSLTTSHVAGGLSSNPEKYWVPMEKRCTWGSWSNHTTGPTPQRGGFHVFKWSTG